jgi:hypothetical protein
VITVHLQHAGFHNVGQTSQRAAGVCLAPLSTLTGGAIGVGFPPLPRAVGVGVTIETDVIDVRGYNVFFAMAACTGADLSFRIAHRDPTVLGFPLLLVRTIGTVTAGAGLAGLNGGFGNAVAAGGNDTFEFITLRFVNVGAAPATLDQFPGLFATVR